MSIFNSLHDFMLETKTLTYVLMGVGVIALACYWRFIAGRDEDIRKY